VVSPQVVKGWLGVRKGLLIATNDNAKAWWHRPVMTVAQGNKVNPCVKQVGSSESYNCLLPWSAVTNTQHYY
jgi:hypothetical protein